MSLSDRRPEKADREREWVGDVPGEERLGEADDPAGGGGGREGRIAFGDEALSAELRTPETCPSALVAPVCPGTSDAASSSPSSSSLTMPSPVVVSQ